MKAWAETIFPEPSHMREMVVVGVDCVDAEVNKLKGSWRQITPEEITHSLVFHIAGQIQDNVDDSVLRKWREIILSIPVMFVILDGEDSVYWEAWGQRQRTGV